MEMEVSPMSPPEFRSYRPLPQAPISGVSFLGMAAGMSDSDSDHHADHAEDDDPHYLHPGMNFQQDSPLAVVSSSSSSSHEAQQSSAVSHGYRRQRLWGNRSAHPRLHRSNPGSPTSDREDSPFSRLSSHSHRRRRMSRDHRPGSGHRYRRASQQSEVSLDGMHYGGRFGGIGHSPAQRPQQSPLMGLGNQDLGSFLSMMDLDHSDSDWSHYGGEGGGPRLNPHRPRPPKRPRSPPPRSIFTVAVEVLRGEGAGPSGGETHEGNQDSRNSNSAAPAPGDSPVIPRDTDETFLLLHTPSTEARRLGSPSGVFSHSELATNAPPASSTAAMIAENSYYADQSHQRHHQHHQHHHDNRQQPQQSRQDQQQQRGGAEGEEEESQASSHPRASPEAFDPSAAAAAGPGFAAMAQNGTGPQEIQAPWLARLRHQAGMDASAGGRSQSSASVLSIAGRGTAMSDDGPVSSPTSATSPPATSAGTMNFPFSSSSSSSSSSSISSSFSSSSSSSSSGVPASSAFGGMDVLSHLAGTNFPSAQTDGKPTFVLVHGPWGGAWMWEKVIPYLVSAGCRVVAPDMAGLGRDSTPLEEASLRRSVELLVRTILEIPQPVILVGHSWGGMVISQTAEYIPDRIAYLVYLSAFLPENGRHLLHYGIDVPLQQGLDPGLVPRNLRAAVGTPEEGPLVAVVLTMDSIYETLFNRCSEEDAKHCAARLQPHPAITYDEVVEVSEAGFGRVPRAYIMTTHDNAIPPALQAYMIAQTPCDPIVSLVADHSPMYSATEDLSRELLKIGKRSELQRRQQELLLKQILGSSPTAATPVTPVDPSSQLHHPPDLLHSAASLVSSLGLGLVPHLSHPSEHHQHQHHEHQHQHQQQEYHHLHPQGEHHRPFPMQQQQQQEDHHPEPNTERHRSSDTSSKSDPNSDNRKDDESRITAASTGSTTTTPTTISVEELSRALNLDLLSPLPPSDTLPQLLQSFIHPSSSGGGNDADDTALQKTSNSPSAAAAEVPSGKASPRRHLEQPS